MKILIVRLGALGDVVHALPAMAALRRALPDAELNWLVDRRYAAILELVEGLDRSIVVDPARAWRATAGTIRALRRERYDVAIDLQGLIKSAVLARLSGARRVIGFSRRRLREPLAASFYTERHSPGPTRHVIAKNLALAAVLGADSSRIEFPLVRQPSGVVSFVRAELGAVEDGRFAVLNPGAAWPNKRWPAERFGWLAAWLKTRFGLPSTVLWGPGEQPLAEEVARRSSGAARVAPATSLADVIALCRVAALVVAGDTGPLHLAAAVGAPVVGLYGPTSAERNGPWAEGDLTVSRYRQCACHHRRRCRLGQPCLESITLEQVQAAVARRLGLVEGR